MLKELQNNLSTHQKYPSTLGDEGGLDSLSLGSYTVAWSLNYPSELNSPAVPHPKHIPAYIKKRTGHPTSVNVSHQHKPSREYEGGSAVVKQRSSLPSAPTLPPCSGTAALCSPADG